MRGSCTREESISVYSRYFLRCVSVIERYRVAYCCTGVRSRSISACDQCSVCALCCGGFVGIIIVYTAVIEYTTIYRGAGTAVSSVGHDVCGVLPRVSL